MVYASYHIGTWYKAVEPGSQCILPPCQMMHACHIHTCATKTLSSVQFLHLDDSCQFSTWMIGKHWRKVRDTVIWFHLTDGSCHFLYLTGAVFGPARFALTCPEDKILSILQT